MTIAPFALPARFVALSLTLLAASAAAQVVHVPGDFPTLASAVAGVPADAVIVVHGGTWPPITLTQPVTIVGSPQVTIDNTDAPDLPNPFSLVASITLEGVGFGRVTLENVRTWGFADGGLFSSSGEGILGGGFAELHLVDCDVQPAQWVLLTGQAQGADAIAVDVPYVLVERCTIIGGLSDTDDCDYPSNPSGGAAMRMPGGTIAVLDSVVTGGRGPIMCFSAGHCPGGPLPDSDGGAGIVAHTVLPASSTITGGKGQPVTCGSALVGTEPDGPAIVADVVTDLGSALGSSGGAVLGAGWTLSWSTSPGAALLAFGTPSTPPLDLGDKGFLFLDASTLHLLVVAGGMAGLSSTLPATAGLAGMEFGVQIYDVASKQFTRPVVAVLRP
ncbi:MAG TPA: hypothetical protein VFY71_19110 [Planctomycetota bacterium]|nr:hypothetical protein [Planctomycetota bacterium]